MTGVRAGEAASPWRPSVSRSMRERWYDERLRWDEWRKEAKGEKRELLRTIKELRGCRTTYTTPEKERSPSNRSCSTSEGDTSESVPPQEEAREIVADSVSAPSTTVAPSTGVESSLVTTEMGGVICESECVS